jgi:hypothetical protein
MRDNMMSYAPRAHVKREEVEKPTKEGHTDIERYIENVVKSMIRDDVQVSIDTAGNLTKLFYAVADEKKVDAIIEKYKEDNDQSSNPKK